MSTADPYQDLDPSLARALNALRAELDERLAALRSELGLATRPVDTAGPSAPDYGALLEIVQRLDEAGDQSELLGRMLEGTGRFAGRSLFLLVRGDEVEGWGGYGFPPETAAGVRAALSTLAPLAACIERRASAALSAQECLGLLGSVEPGDAPAEGILIPFTLRGRVAAVLYADRGAGQSLTAPALQLLAYTAANSLETLPLRRAAVATPVAEAGVEPGVPAADQLAALREEAEVEPPSAVERQADVAPPEAEAGEAVTPASTVESPAAEVDAGPASEPPLESAEPGDAGPLDTLAIARSSVEVAEPPGIEELPEPLETAAARPEPTTGIEQLGGRSPAGGSIEVAPPPDLEGPGWAFRDRQASADESRREEARRLARLLVTEIKLYNEEQVEEGLERGNLYATLQEEIDRSRRIFEERIPEDVRAEADYFRDELVRILADGDSSALGR